MRDHDAAPERAYLDDMPRGELDCLINALTALSDAGAQVERYGHSPLFNLTDINGFSMSIDYRLPLTRAQWQAATPRTDGENFDPDPAPAARVSGGGQEASAPAAAHEPKPTPEPEQTALAAEAEGAGDGGAEVAASDPAVATEIVTPEIAGPEIPLAAAIGQALASAADQMPTADLAARPPVPGSASALAALTVWSDAEDARLIQITVGAMIAGAPKVAAIRAAAEDLGRPFSGAQSRLYGRLKTTFEVALREAEARKNHADPIPAPAAPSSSPAAGASDGGAVSPAAPVAPDDDPQEPAPIAATKAPLSPIEAHLFALPAKGGWTMARDFNLLSLAEDGWKQAEIAEDMGLDARQVQDRWDKLSGFNAETKVRRWTRAELIAALRGWVAGNEGGK